MSVGEWEGDEHSLKEESLPRGVSVFWECVWMWDPSNLEVAMTSSIDLKAGKKNR